ncbi:MAG: redoxin domain-containing protein [Pirellulales bacterium]
MRHGRTTWIAGVIALTSIVLVGPASGEVTRPPLGAAVESFTLASHRGTEWSLGDFEDNRLVVVVFLGTECPLAQLYAPRLAKLQEEFADQGVAFLGINSNTQDSMTELTAYANRHKLPFPLLKDVGNRVADQFGARRTPEAFVLDRARKIRYRGRIDDQYGVGYSRDEVQRRDLAVALEELLAEKPVSVPETEAFGCHIGRVKRLEPQGEVTYSNQISRIFNKSCVECHREGEIAPFALGKYEDTIGWEDTILEVVDEGRMPPWFANPEHGTFRNDARLSGEEKALIHRWVENGMPEGDPAELPEPPSFVKGWRMPKPDQVVAMGEEPFTVPAEGVVDYQYFRADPKWTEDKYISAAEARPDNTRVVHHIIVYVVPPGASGNFRNRAMLVGYAPGSDPIVLAEGMAMHVPAGSQLMFEVHYTPNGVEQPDRSYVGFKFVDGKDVKKELRGRLAINRSFRIPPGAENHEVTADYRTSRDELLMSMTPHMHLRGKAFRYEAFYPDGRQEILLDVPRYDFNWQLSYKLAEPKLLPAGTRIVCTAWFDNSKYNPVNPDPSKEIRWGDQSWEEMMIGFFNTISPDRQTSAAPLSTDVSIDPSGTWQWKRDGATETLTIDLEGGRLSGVLKTPDREMEIEQAVMKDDELTFHVALTGFATEVTIDFRGTVKNDSLTGEATFKVDAIGRSQSFPWTAKRVDEPQ